ncbi:MAG: hypothetical protein PF445_12460 [Melioribacteraceae bacterium]|nr:hypothetical protein [Melioribacteraceae bacterium]
MIYKLTVSYKLNGVWKRASKEFEDKYEMRIKIKAFLNNSKYSNQCYWINEIKKNGE